MKKGMSGIGTILSAVLLSAIPAMADVGPESDTNDTYWDDQLAIPGTSGSVYASAGDVSGNMYVGGKFWQAGNVKASRIAKWDGTSWSALGTGFGNGVSDYDCVNAVACDASGNVYAGGGIYVSSNSLRGRVQKWDGNTWAVLPAVGSIIWQVDALACDASGNLYAGGEFYGGNVNRIAKWDGTSWSALGVGMNHYVYALACDASGNLYAGGEFTTAGGMSANYVAKWDGTTWSALGTGMNNIVRSLAVDGSGNVYAGGQFTMAGSATANYVAKWDGSTWSALGGGTAHWVYALKVDGSGSLYAGGGFTTADGVTVNSIAKWDGALWSDLEGGMSKGTLTPIVYTLAADILGNLFAGGQYIKTAGTVGVSNIAKWNGSAWSALGTGMNDTVYALTYDEAGNLYVGGSFTSSGSVNSNRVSKWDGNTWVVLDTGMNNSISALMCDATGNLYAGGSFTIAGGVSANRVAKWDGSAWFSLGTGTNNSVAALAGDVSGNLYAGGGFTTADGMTVNRLAKWDGSTWTALGTGMNNYVYALVCDTFGNLYAGGSFTTAGGLATNRVAKWDGSTWSTLGTGMNSDVYALSFDNIGNLYAGGQFSNAGGVSAQYVAKWDGSTWSALDTGMNIKVWALSCDQSGNLYAGGGFSMAGGVPAKGVAKWNGNSWAAFGTGINNIVNALAVKQNTLVTGGTFTLAGGKVSGYLAQWQPRVNKSQMTISENPGMVTLGNDSYGFYRPSLQTNAGTTVSYPGGLPVIATIDRANEITVGGQRVNGACTLGPNGMQFDGAVATLRVEFSEDDAAAYGTSYTDFRVARLIYPDDYPANKQAVTVALLSTETPSPLRIENGRQIFSITAPLSAIDSTYGAVPESLLTPDAPSNPIAVSIGIDTITWDWHDNSDDEMGFNIWEDQGEGPATTYQITQNPDIHSWSHSGLSTNTQYAFRVAAMNANGESEKTPNVCAWTLAVTPEAPEVFTPTGHSLCVSISANTNPAYTLYALQISPTVNGNSWVQADGSLGTNAVFQTSTAWAIKNVTGLVEATAYILTTTAQNGAGTNTTAGPGTILSTLDITPPVITRTGNASVTVECDGNYSDAGATVLDNFDPSVNVVVGGDTVDTSILGVYTVTYNARDDAGNNAVEVTRSVTIAPKSLILTSPTGGESWTIGNTYTTTWTGACVGSSIKMKLWQNGSFTGYYLTGIEANDGLFAWKIPANLTAGSGYKVEVYTSNYSQSDLSNASFTLAPKPVLTLTTPNGGEAWMQGSSQSVTWTSTGVGALVKLKLWKGGVFTGTFLTGEEANDGSYTWKIPSGLAPGTDYQIQVYTPNYVYSDLSDNYFTVQERLRLTSPNGDETWRQGSKQTITWVGLDSGLIVKLRLYKGGVFTGTYLTSEIANDGDYVWTVPTNLTPGTDYKIHLYTPDYLYSDYSDAPFMVEPALTSPNGGETWTRGNVYPVTWNTPEMGASIKLKLYKDGAFTGYYLTGIIDNDGTYDWRIPVSLQAGTGYKIMLYTPDYSMSDYSDAPFMLN